MKIGGSRGNSSSCRRGRGRRRARGGCTVGDNHLILTSFSTTTSSHFNFAARDRKLLLSGPKRAHQNGNIAAANTNNNNNNNNNGISITGDFYLHKKFKKVAPTVDPSASSVTAADDGKRSVEMETETKSNKLDGSSLTNSSSSSTTASTCGIVYKPKFRLKGVAENTEDEQIQLHYDPTLEDPTSLLASLPTTEKDVITNNFEDEQIRLHYEATEKSPSTPPPLSNASTENATIKPGNVGRESTLDRKSLDDHITKIISQNKSILEWPSQFKKIRNFCGGEMSESLNETGVGKSFQDNAFRRSNGTVLGELVQTVSSSASPIDLTKIDEPVTSSLLHQLIKPISLTSSSSFMNFEDATSSDEGSIEISGSNEIQKSQGSHGWTSDLVPVDSATSIAPGISLLRLVPPPPEIPGPSTGESSLIRMSFGVPGSNSSTPALTLTTTANVTTTTSVLMMSSVLLAEGTQSIKNEVLCPLSSANSPLLQSASSSNISLVEKQKKSSNLDAKSENSNQGKDNSFQVVPTATPMQNHPKRPTFLALKPINANLKKTEPGVLPSPETPRVAKPYNQMTMNGKAYTYLGFKVSTRSSYTCLFKTQPMFIPQDTDKKLSMYSNWQPRPRNPNMVEFGISTYDSRANGRKSPRDSLYTSARGKSCDTLTSNSPNNQSPILSSPIFESKNETESTNKIPSTIQRDVGNRERESTSPSQYQLCIQPIEVQVSPNRGGVTFDAAGEGKIAGSRGLPDIVAVAHPSDSTSALANGMISILKRRRTSTVTSQDDEDTLSNLSEDPFKDGAESGRMSESKRIKIMEGGWKEENDGDYQAYIRGRGRGRFVCEACGIRCKKPSMLRKHLKTHTDLRPYKCKLCNFGFKTKGNLTKHQKSKSHLKKCASLGIHPESSTSLAMSGPIFPSSDTNSNTTDDCDSDDGEEDNEETDSKDESESGSANGNYDRVERDNLLAAQSLLDLSKAAHPPLEIRRASSDCESSNDARSMARQVGFLQHSGSNSSLPMSFSVGAIVSSTSEAPIDLSFKPVAKEVKAEHSSASIQGRLEVNSTVKEPVSMSKIPSISPPQISSGATSTSTVKLHQPWLSPSGVREKKKPPSLMNAPPDALQTCKFEPPEDPEVFVSKSPPPESMFTPNGPTASVLESPKFLLPSGPHVLAKDEGKSECKICGKTFTRASQLNLHLSVHVLERPYKCEPCGVSFRTKGHLIKHRRSSSHDCKVYLTEAWGVANQENPRPFKCTDCKVAFRIHGHLAKHLRSKMHIIRLECLAKLPPGLFYAIETSSFEISCLDTTDCDTCLVSLQDIARKIYGEQWRDRLQAAPVEEAPA